MERAQKQRRMAPVNYLTIVLQIFMGFRYVNAAVDLINDRSAQISLVSGKGTLRAGDLELLKKDFYWAKGCLSTYKANTSEAPIVRLES